MNGKRIPLAALALVVSAGTALGGAYRPGDAGYWPFANLAPTGTTSGNGSPASRVVDGEVALCTTHVGGYDVTFEWFERFSSPTTIELIRHYHMYGRDIQSWELAYDSDPTAGENFVVLQSGDNSRLGRMDIYDVNITTDALRYRVYSGPASLDPRGWEIELYNSTDGLPLAIINDQVTTTAHSSASKGSAAVLINNLIDGGSGWQPGSVASSTSEWAYYLFDDARLIHSVRVLAEAGTRPSALAVQYLADGGDPANDADWLAWNDISGLPSNWGTIWFHDGPDGYVTTRGVRLYITGNTNGGSWFRLGEIEIYEQVAAEAAIPEPASALLLAAGLGVLLRRRRRA